MGICCSKAKKRELYQNFVCETKQHQVFPGEFEGNTENQIKDCTNSNQNTILLHKFESK